MLSEVLTTRASDSRVRKRNRAGATYGGVGHSELLQAAEEDNVVNHCRTQNSESFAIVRPGKAHYLVIGKVGDLTRWTAVERH